MKDEDFQPEDWIVWFFRENAAFILKILIFLVGFAALTAGEYHLVLRRANARIASERSKDSVAPAPTPAQGAAANGSISNPPQNSAAPYLVKDAFQRMREHDLDGALDQLNLALQADPKNALAYELRGDIYSAKKLWDEATKNYQIVCQLDNKNMHVRFNLAEIQFIQKKYDLARPGFVALENQAEMGDISAYKAFLCDLFGGHEDAAAKELDAFNQVGSNASYYFSNVAWSLYHHQTEEARGWLTSATNIYSPVKVKVYSLSLIELGYLPLPSVPPALH